MIRQLLFKPDVYENCVRRIESLSAESTPEWGTMSVGQMLAHCAEIQEVSNGKPLEGTPWIIRVFGPLVRRMVLSDKPFPRSTKTHPQYVQTSRKEFEIEKVRLLDALERSRAAEDGRPAPHPLFGMLTREERGWLYYKHLDHHLTQFGV